MIPVTQRLHLTAAVLFCVACCEIAPALSATFSDIPDSPDPQLIVTGTTAPLSSELEAKIGVSIPGNVQGRAVGGNIAAGKLKLSGDTELTLFYRFLTDEKPLSSFDLAFTVLNRRLEVLERSTILAGVSTEHAGKGFARGTGIRASSFHINKNDNDFAVGLVDTGDTLVPSGLEFLLVDTGAISSAAVTGLPMAIIQREAAISSINTAMRDVNGRLFRLRSRQADAGPNEALSKESVAIDAKAKTALSADSAFGQVELFGSGDYGSVDRDRINGTPGIYSDTYAGTAGLEYHPTRNLTLGASLTGVHNHLQLGQNVGQIEVAGVMSSIYASWFTKNFYVDALYGVAVLDHEIKRNALFGNTARANPESWSQIFQLNTGYNLSLHGVVTGPFASFNYVNGEVDGYRESGHSTGNLQTGAQSYDSLASQLGWQISCPLPTAIGTVTPQLRVAWGHEWRNDSEAVNVQTVESPFYLHKGNRWKTQGKGLDLSSDYSPADRDYVLIGAGASVQLTERCLLALDYEAHVLRAASVEQFVSVHAALSF